jgi:hypothetical protein
MQLKCNIDSRGKRARLVSGLIMVVIAIFMGWWGWSAHLRLVCAIAVVLGCVGLFSIFEARAGWCALRAMRFKTPI